MRIGILGAGRIATLVAQTLCQMEDMSVVAVGARDKGRAQTLADACGAPRAYGSYEELVADPAVDLVYITTILAFHAPHMRLCIEAGKPVLCEKSFTLNAAEAREVIHLAQQRGVFVAEAIWPRYMPMAATLRELANSQRLGTIHSLEANLGYPNGFRPRMSDPALGGGALLDIGVYPLTFASICFGDEVEEIVTGARLSERGVDLESSIQLLYRDGRRAYLFNTCLTPTDRSGKIYGEKGYAVVDNVNNYERITIYDADHQVQEVIPRPQQISGYEYQFRAAAEAIQAGAIECPAMPHGQTIRMMELMDQLRARWGVRYPGD